MKRVIITGATGMIASSLIKILINENIEVIAIARPNSQKLNNIPKNSNVKIIECDLSDLLTLENKISQNCDVFFHFGWMGTIGTERNDSYLQLNNIQYTLDAVKLAKSLNCNTFIGAGSQAEYGITEDKLSPNLKVNPVTGYGVAKFAAGKLSRLLAEDLGLKHVWTRILSVYGPKDNHNTMIMSLIDSILNQKPFRTTKGEQLWDYLYSDDCAEAFYLLSKYGQNGQVYTIGSGKALSLKEYMYKIRDMINPSYELKFGELEYAPNQVMYLCADISKLTNDTGFEPKISFEEGINRIINIKMKVD